MGTTNANDGPGRNRGVLRLDCLGVGGDLSGNAGSRVLLEKCAEALLLLVGVRRVPCNLGLDDGHHSHLNIGVDLLGNAPLNGAGLALEKVRDEHLVLGVVVAGRQDVRTLDSLIEVAEDVVDNDNSLGRLGRASYI